MPPWPGKIEPESFTPALLLNADSTKSPTCPATFPAAASPRTIGVGTFTRYESHHPSSKAPARLAAAPSHVLLGLRMGAILCFPIQRPTKYAAVSPTQVITSAKSKIQAPTRPPKPCNRTA